MRIPGKTSRANTDTGVNFDDYSWDGWRGPGWWRGVVLNVLETESKAGSPMLKVTFGLESPDADALGARIEHYCPESYEPKVIELARVFLPQLLDADEDAELDPASLRFRRCAVRIDMDASYKRLDGKPAWRVVKLLTIEEADADLGEGWDQAVLEQADQQDEADHDDVF